MILPKYYNEFIKFINHLRQDTNTKINIKTFEDYLNDNNFKIIIFLSTQIFDTIDKNKNSVSPYVFVSPYAYISGEPKNIKVFNFNDKDFYVEFTKSQNNSLLSEKEKIIYNILKKTKIPYFTRLYNESIFDIYRVLYFMSENIEKFGIAKYYSRPEINKRYIKEFKVLTGKNFEVKNYVDFTINFFENIQNDIPQKDSAVLETKTLK